MNSNLNSEQIQADFLNEAQELLQIIEQELLSLREEKTPAKVHNLMRAAHTLKGSSASVGLNNLSQIAHGLEGIFKSLYNPDLIVDKELDTLLFQAYEYLRLSVTETTASRGENDPDVLNRAASILAEVQIKLGDDFNPDAAIPSSVELGFDVVGSIFEVGVKQRLSELEAMLSEGDAIAVTQTLQNCTEIFIGLAESLNLPGFGAIARLAEQALHVAPERALKVAQIALADLQAAHRAVIEGDRASGGQPSPALRAIAAGEDPPEPAVEEAEIEEASEPPTQDSSEEVPVERDRPVLFPLPEELEAIESANAEAEPPAEDKVEIPDEPDFETAEPDLESWEVSAESAGSPTNGYIAYNDEAFELQDSEASAHPTLDQVFGNFDPALLSDFPPAEAGEEEEGEAEELPPELLPATAPPTPTLPSAPPQSKPPTANPSPNCPAKPKKKLSKAQRPNSQNPQPPERPARPRPYRPCESNWNA